MFLKDFWFIYQLIDWTTGLMLEDRWEKFMLVI